MKVLERILKALENGEGVSNSDAWVLVYRIKELETRLQAAQRDNDASTQVTINRHTAQELASYADWANCSLDELVNRVCCQWIAERERSLGNTGEAQEWLDHEGADLPD